MTIQAYTRALRSEGIEVCRVHFTNFYPFNGSSFDVDGTLITAQIVAYDDDQSLCEFFDAAGNLVARAKSFESVI